MDTQGKIPQARPASCSMVVIAPGDVHPGLEWPADDDMGLFTPASRRSAGAAERDDAFLCSETPNRHVVLDVKYVGRSCWHPGDRLARTCALGYAVEMVTEGRGVLVCAGRRYELVPGDVFILHPGEQHMYQAHRTVWRKEYLSFRARDERIAYVMGVLGLDGISHVRMDAAGQARCRDLFARMQECARRMEPRFHLRVSHLAHELLLGLAEAVFGAGQEPAVHPCVAHAIAHAHEKLGETISVALLAKQSGCTPSHLNRLFKHDLNMTAHEWLERFRLRCAAALLCKTNSRIHVIAEHVGYSDPYYFSTAFKRVAGVCPLTYRHMGRQGRITRAARKARRAHD